MHVNLLCAVFVGLPQEVSGDSGHPVRPQEAPGEASPLWHRLHTGGQEQSGQHPLHHPQVHVGDREQSARHEGIFTSDVEDQMIVVTQQRIVHNNGALD